MSRLRFRTRIFAALAAIVCVSLAVIALLLQSYTARRVHETARERFERTQAAFHQLEALRERFFADEVESLAAANPQFRPILATASLASADLGFGGAGASTADPLRDANLRLDSLVPSLALFAKSDIVLVANAAGELLYSKVDPHRFGDDLAEVVLLHEVGAGGSGEAVWHSGQRVGSGAALAPERDGRPALFHVLGRAILFDGALHGAVLVGQEIAEPVLRDLRAITGVDVVLLADGVPAASTLAPELTSDAVAHLASDLVAPAGDREWSLAGQRFLARRAPVIEGDRAPGAEFLLLSSLEPDLAFARRLTHMLALVGGGVLAVALATSWALARGITRPVATLAHAARRVGAGELDTRVEIATRDELEELGGAFNEMVSGLRDRERIRRSFERHVSKSVADEVLRNPGLLAGSRREITALFVDLGGFTSLAETLAPEAVVAHLNEYFEAACRAILAEDGAVSEFQGDGVVAFWGAPIAHGDDAARACRAALACERELAALQQRWEQRGLSLAGFRIGLHTGEMVVGEVGSAERGKYAVVGDAMNLASRIEGANKHYGTRSLASEATRERAGAAVECREIDTVRVIGRRQPVRLFQLLARVGDLAPERARARERFAAGLAAYRARDWDGAERGFAAAVECDPEDGAARVFLARVARLRAAPPPADWDAVFALDTK
jgi:class 3 adenylate cyclase